MVNETIDGLFARKSVRSFTDEEISPENRQLILASAAQAPTAGNQQLYTILDITDPALKKELSRTCDGQPMIAGAKLVLIFCADCRKWYDAYAAAGCAPRKPAAGDLMLAVCDAAIAAQNAVTAAWSLGIGSCFIGDIMENCEEQRSLLRLPEYVFPAVMVIFGYPTPQQLQREKPGRADLRFVVQENGYTPLTPAQLEEMWTPRCGEKPYPVWMRAFCDRKYNSAFSREMSRSVEEYLRQFQD